MNKQRKVVITTTYNEMGIIIDTKAEEVAQPEVAKDTNVLTNDCISRQAAIDATWFEPSYTDPLNVLTEVRDRLKVLPSAQPERKRGRWIPVTNGRGGHECNLCHTYAPSFKSGDEWLTDYCGNCGARMEGE